MAGRRPTAAPLDRSSAGLDAISRDERRRLGASAIEIPDDVDRAATLYLDLLKGCLTRQLFPDDAIPMPLRRRDQLVARLRRAVAGGKPSPIAKRRDYEPELRAVGRDWPAEAETMIGRARLDNLQACIVDVLRDDVPGDLIETGVWRGGATILMRATLEAYGDVTRCVWLADSFEGVPKPDERYPADAGDQTWTVAELTVTEEQVKANFARYDLLDERVKIVRGWFKDSLPTAPIGPLAILRSDGDLYESTIDALTPLYPKLSVGGYVIIDDYGTYPACRAAVDEFRAQHHVTSELRDIDGSGVFWRRSASDG